MLDWDAMPHELKLQTEMPLDTVHQNRAQPSPLTLQQRQEMEARGQQKKAKQATQAELQLQRQREQQKAQQQASTNKARKQRQHQDDLVAQAAQRMKMAEEKRAAAAKLVDAREVEARKAAKAK